MASSESFIMAVWTLDCSNNDKYNFLLFSINLVIFPRNTFSNLSYLHIEFGSLLSSPIKDNLKIIYRLQKRKSFLVKTLKRKYFVGYLNIVIEAVWTVESEAGVTVLHPV